MEPIPFPKRFNAAETPEMSSTLPETPHDLPLIRSRIDDLLVRVKAGEAVNLLDELLGMIDWRAAFVDEEGKPLLLQDLARLHSYYRKKWSDIGPVYIAELMSTEFMTEQRAQGDIVFSDRLLNLGRTDPQLWNEIRLFFRRKELVTALFVAAHASAYPVNKLYRTDAGEEF